MSDTRTIAQGGGLDEGDDRLADLAAELADGLRRGAAMTPEDLAAGDARVAEELRRLLPAIRELARLGDSSSEPGGLRDYRIVREVARGGIGVVYEAVHSPSGRRVALKVLSHAALDARGLRRFRLEAEATAGLDHPNIVPVLANGTDRGIPFYAMPFIDGPDLARVIERRAIGRERGGAPPSESAEDGPASYRGAAWLARQAAEALEYAHARGILHRDIKPSNLLVDGDDHLWIADFGLAHVPGDLGLTQSGDILGTPRFMSPEQAVGRRAILDGRSDIYSLGATLYELLTLRPAFSGEDRLDLLRKIIHEEPMLPRRIDPSIPIDLETIVLMALAKDPSGRYGTAAELAADLGRFLEGQPILARRPGLSARLGKWARRNRTEVAAMTAVLGLSMLGAAAGAWRYAAILRGHNAALHVEIDRADRHQREGDRQRRLAARHADVAGLRLAQQSIDARQFELAQDLLGSIGEDGGVRDEFTWGLLRRAARRELVRLPARESRPFGLSLSRDGALLAAGYRDGAIVLWDLATERARHVLGPDGFSDPMLTPDGRLLVARHEPDGRDGPRDLIVWEPATGRVVARHSLDDAPRGRPIDEFLLCGGRFVACRWYGGTGQTWVRIWASEQASGPPKVSIDGTDHTAFAAVAGVFAVVRGTHVGLHRVDDGSLLDEFSVPGAPITNVSLSDDGRTLALRTASGVVIVRGSSCEAEEQRFQSGESVAALVLAPGGESLAVVDEAGLVHLWDRHSGRSRVIRPDDLDRRRYRALPVFWREGSRIATRSGGDVGGRQPSAVWDVASGKRLGLLPSQDQDSTSLAFSPDGRSLIDDGGRSPRIWHFDPPREEPAPAGHSDEAWSVGFSPDGRVLASGSDDTDEPETIKLWDAATGRRILGWNGGRGTVSSLAFSPDGRILATGHLVIGPNVRLWDATTGRDLATFDDGAGPIRCVAFNPAGTSLAAAGKDGVIRLWDVATGQLGRALSGHSDNVRCVAFSHDGRWLASASHDGTLRLWDVAGAGAGRIERGLTKWVALAFAPDETLVAADDAGRVTVRDARNLQDTQTLKGESEELLGLAIANDGRTLATPGMSGTIRLWDIPTGQESVRLRGHRAQVNAVAFSPDGAALASACHDGSVRDRAADPTRGARPREDRSMTARKVQDRLRELGSPEAAASAARYFKIGAGQYGEGDVFLGLRAAEMHRLAREYQAMPLDELVVLLQSPIHEDRMLALLIMVRQFVRGDEASRKAIHQLYLANTRYINNWDLVDASAREVVGGYLADRARKPLDRLAASASLWERRISIVATHYFIRNQEFADTLRIAERLLGDREDLIHKAVGWMLRELGKRHQPTLESFLKRHGRIMPRTALRYAIERFPAELRRAYLDGSACDPAS